MFMDIFKDPMHMTDEDFFGVWSEVGNTWSVVPVLRYDIYDDLKNVCDCAKLGDYSDAKYALWEYYKDRSAMPPYKTTTSPHATGLADFMLADMMTEKIFSFAQMDMPVGVIEIESDASKWKYYTVDLVGARRLSNTYFLLDSDMDGSFAEVQSRRHVEGHGAYLELIVDGETKILPVIADTYISAGDNKDKNFGKSDILHLQEAAGSTRVPFGTDTGRPYFRFDTSQIKGNITSVKLNFYAKSSAGNKKVFVFISSNEKVFEEEILTWERHYPQAFNFKKTGYIWEHPKVFTEEWHTEYEWINFGSRMYMVGWLMPCYHETGNELYAERALEILMSLYQQQSRGDYARVLEGAW